MRLNDAYPACTVSSTRINAMIGPRKRISINNAAVTAPTVNTPRLTTKKPTSKPPNNSKNSASHTHRLSVIIVRRAEYP